MWGHPSFPKCHINHNDFQETKVQSEAVCVQPGSAPPKHMDQENNVEAVWFNDRIDLIELQCDILITMISASGTFLLFMA